MSARNGKFKNRGSNSKKYQRVARVADRLAAWYSLSDEQKLAQVTRNKARYNAIRYA
jgi:hypothetical protein